MRCGRARRLLWPDEGPRAVTREIEEARAHLDACETCRDFLAEARGTSELLSAHAPRPEAPLAVRERLFAALARARSYLPDGAPPRRPARRHLVGSLAAGLLAVALAGWAGLSLRQESAPASLAAVAEDHIRALQQESLETEDRAAAERWLGERVPFAVRVPELPGASVEGARLCFLGGRRGAVVRYRVGGRPVSYYVMPGAGGKATPDAQAFLEGAEAGYNVVVWRDAGLVHALVGDLPRERLGDLARVCADRLASTNAGAPGSPRLHSEERAR